MDDWLEDSDPIAGPSRTYQQGGAADPLTEREYDRMVARYTDAGYREGITDGKLSTLQQGFDESFELSVPSSRRLGLLRGRTAALLSYHIRKPINSSLTSNSTTRLSNSSTIIKPSVTSFDSVTTSPLNVTRIKNENDIIEVDNEVGGHTEQNNPVFPSRSNVESTEGRVGDSNMDEKRRIEVKQGLKINELVRSKEEIVDILRDLIRELGRVKRVDILPPDLEREAHEREHDELGLVLKPTDERGMEDIQDTLQNLGGAIGGKKEEELLIELEKRLEEIRESLRMV
ncbi:hypothetical protein M231_08050 [Tremella mesenterica]|uniref:Protein YAE1 n=1 Tax=Tremella mesenterica TaxID=5217 RepID=A0A4Q1B7Q2_TREME|nr:hypothetical protein M231_08050 [Tremella mesenterica]